MSDAALYYGLGLSIVGSAIIVVTGWSVVDEMRGRRPSVFRTIARRAKRYPLVLASMGISLAFFVTGFASYAASSGGYELRLASMDRQESLSTLGEMVDESAFSGAEIVSICARCDALEPLIAGLQEVVKTRQVRIRYLVPPEMPASTRVTLGEALLKISNSTGSTITCKVLARDMLIAPRMFALLNEAEGQRHSFASTVVLSDAYAPLMLPGFDAASAAVDEFEKMWSDDLVDCVGTTVKTVVPAQVPGIEDTAAERALSSNP